MPTRVDTRLDYGMEGQGWAPCRGKHCLFSTASRRALRPPECSMEQSGRGIKVSSGVEVKNASTPYVIMACRLVNHTGKFVLPVIIL
jgi:hypothetical protein